MARQYANLFANHCYHPHIITPLDWGYLFKVYINGMIVAVEAANQGITVGEDTVPGLIFADDFVGMSESSEGLQKQIEKTLEYTRKWRVVNSERKKFAVVVCHEDKVNPVTFKWKWGEA